MVNKLLEHHECPIDSFIFKIVDKHLHIFFELGMTPNTLTTLGIFFGFLIKVFGNIINVFCIYNGIH